jgi:hypothetical protein
MGDQNAAASFDPERLDPYWHGLSGSGKTMRSLFGIDLGGYSTVRIAPEARHPAMKTTRISTRKKSIFS